MDNNTELLTEMLEALLYHRDRPTADELRDIIQDLATKFAPNLDDKSIEDLARSIEASQGIKSGISATVDGDNKDFQPWLDEAKSSIDPFYWKRYRKLLTQNGLPKDVVTATDTVTDKILSRLGNPNLHERWDRRGMVVGQVQSGKTANYTGLICKAADAGYRLIIVVAGIHSNLRNQTQERIDEGFIGFDSGKERGKIVGGRRHVVGAGYFGPQRRPVTLTTRFHDFIKARADSDSSEIGAYVEPVVLVIKKNHRTLGNLIDWLRDNSARGDLGMIDQPMLLIDDEADNASINTKYNKSLVTTINGQIRDLLNMFHRSCYVGYTATPFANIFIDPDQGHEMYDEDLFPRDFIIGLGAPSNYFGPTKIFLDGLPDEGEPTYLRSITDNEDVLPVKHPKDFVIETLPYSLLQALRAFVLARTIRNIRGESHKHCSMLINASWRNPIQRQLRNRVHEALERIQNAARLNGARGEPGLRDPELMALKTAWINEFQDAEPNWNTIQSALHESIASMRAVEVNKDSTDQLDYPKEKEGTKGKSYVAIGGYSLSRGLTLEGLTTTWFLRNTKMYDTLMQMGRWFGYRGGYEDLCRIWMPPEAIDWYSFIANAAEELHDELRDMEKAKATPRMFGLAVRSHPASLLVTARNKMGSGKTVTVAVGLSNAFVETAKVSAARHDLEANLHNAQNLAQELQKAGIHQEKTKWGILFRGVSVNCIDKFLAGWRNADESILTRPDPVRRYIRPRASDELRTWDVLLPSLQSGVQSDLLGIGIVPMDRSVGPKDLRRGLLSFSGKGMRVASRGIEKAGVDTIKAENAEARYRSDPENAGKKRFNYPDKIYRTVRDYPLFILNLVNATPPKDGDSEDMVELLPKEPVVAWGMSLPESKHDEETIEYVVNTVRYQELFGEEDVDDDQDAAHEAL